ncbi:MAG: hypothetical protein RJA99_4639 [Pseudomonadota bacterium]|jgi:hypothetical protein
MTHPVASLARRALAALALAGTASAAALPVPAAAQLRAFEFALDNDQFAFASRRDERWYTSGGFIRAAFDAPAGTLAARLAGAWCAVGPACDRDARTLAVLSLNHEIHTPASPGTPVPQPYDRPYAGVLTLGADAVVAGERTRQTLSLRLGTIGPAALGREVQNGIHRLLGQPLARGWDGQVRAQPAVQLGWSRLVAWHEPGSAFDVVGRTALRIGSPVTDAAVGAMMRLGARPVGPSWPGETIGVREPEGWQGFVGVEARAVAWDATIDGATYQYASLTRHERLAGRVFAGASVGAFRDWRLEFTVALHSVSFEAPLEPVALRPQRIGTIGLRWQPTR